MADASAILFDLDDTLVQETTVVAEAFRATAELARDRYGVDPEQLHLSTRSSARELWYGNPDHPFAKRVGISSWEALWARFLGDLPEVARFRAWAPDYRHEAWRGGLEALGVHDDGLAGQLAERFVVERRGMNRPFPETRAVLGLLRERHEHRLGLLTNGLSCLQREKIHGAGLEPYFDAVCVSGDLGVGKPDRHPFRHLLDRLGSSPERAAMVGDNPERDVAGAQASGLRGIWLDRGDRRPVEGVTPDLIIKSLEEVLELAL
jgi:putative hydrolase of the HAD superfamily